MDYGHRAGAIHNGAGAAIAGEVVDCCHRARRSGGIEVAQVEHGLCADAGRGSVCNQPLIVLREQVNSSFPFYMRGGIDIKIESHT